MRTCRNSQWATNRRSMLRNSAAGFGAIALAALNARWSHAGATGYTSPLAPKAPHFPARAKHVIFLYMEGGPSHIDTFDWKPELARIAPAGKARPLAAVSKFKPCGESGLMLAADLFPHLARHADELCLVNSVQTKNNGHNQSCLKIHTGTESFVRPSMGAWVVYGLGTQAEDLP